LFLSATPHNGHSNSFSALLEILDPQRFVRGVKPVKRNLEDVMVRRLKEDLREVLGGFPKREIVQNDLDGLPIDAPELRLAELLDQYRLLCEKRLESESEPRGGRIVEKAGAMGSVQCLVHAEILGGRKTTEKLAIARRQRIPIITEEQFFKLAGIGAR
jgi:hypothetical protein